MKIIWLAPYPINKIDDNVFAYSLLKPGKGMWLVNLLENLKEYKEIDFNVITYASKISKDIIINKNNTTFYVLRYSIPFIKKGFPTYFPIHKIFQYPYLKNKIKKIIKNINPDLIHIHGTEDVYILPPIKLDYPIIVSIQGIVEEIYRAKKTLNYYFQKKIELKGIKTYKNFGCRTSFDTSFVKRINKNANIYYMPEAINEVFFQKEYKPINNRTLNFVGSVSKVKGIEILIKAIENIKNTFPDIKVNIIGPVIKNYHLFLINLINDLKLNENFVFHGFKTSDEIVNLHLESQLFVLPSFIENSPNSLCEAMAIGLPCIASNTGGIPSIISNGENGILVEPGNIKELSHSIIKLLINIDFANRLGNNARMTAIKRHLPSEVSRITMEVYKTILNNEL